MKGAKRGKEGEEKMVVLSMFFGGGVKYPLPSIHIHARIELTNIFGTSKSLPMKNLLATTTGSIATKFECRHLKARSIQC